MKNTITVVFYTFLALAAIAVAFLTYSNRDLARIFFSRCGYYLIFLLVLLWLLTLLHSCRFYKPDVKGFLKAHRYGLISAFLLTAIIFVSVHPSFRVLSDETNLLDVAKSMTYEKRTDQVLMGKWYYDNFYPIERITPVRHLLFPFFIHIFHTILGYRAENVFLLNFLVLFTLFFLIYKMVKAYLGDIWALSTIVVVASQAIVSQVATSGAYDLMAALFLIICFMCLKRFLKDPSAMNFQLLLVNLLMFSSIRYEGIVASAIVLFLLLVFGYIRIGYFKSEMNVVLFAAPLILLLPFCQWLLAKRQFVAQGVKFTFDFFVKNNVLFLKTLFDHRFFLPYATVVNLIGVLSLVYFGYLLISGKVAREKQERHLVIISAIPLVVIWSFFTSYYEGMITLPSSTRYYVGFAVLLSIAAVMFAHSLKIFSKKPGYILVLSIVVFFLYHPVSVEERFTRTQTLPREYRFVLDYLKKESKFDRNFLVITKRPGQYTVHDYGAVNFKYANNNRSIGLEFANRLYDNVYVIQDIEYATQNPTGETFLSERYKLEKASELQNNSKYYIRISKVTAITIDNPRPN